MGTNLAAGEFDFGACNEEDEFDCRYNDLQKCLTNSRASAAAGVWNECSLAVINAGEIARTVQSSTYRDAAGAYFEADRAYNGNAASCARMNSHAGQQSWWFTDFKYWNYVRAV